MKKDVTFNEEEAYYNASSQQEETQISKDSELNFLLPSYLLPNDTIVRIKTLILEPKLCEETEKRNI